MRSLRFVEDDGPAFTSPPFRTGSPLDAGHAQREQQFFENGIP
ncbi:MAG TPA: hypothetical protein VKZ53_25530 [Candidatus Angelobacter sp.]|nr:hypothetical protein [Candidatus Angelobacter sp.]